MQLVGQPALRIPDDALLAEFPIGPGTDSVAGYAPAARDSGIDEEEVLGVCERLNANLAEDELATFEDCVQGKTIEEPVKRIGCSESKIPYLRKRIRDKMLSS